MKRNKEKMTINKKTLLLRIFQKWINKSYWITKIQKQKIKINKKMKNLNNKKMKRKINKKSNKKCKKKTVNKFKKKAKLKEPLRKRKELEVQNMKLLQT